MTEKIIDVQNETKIDDEKKWCVYMHTSPSGKKYIGITGNKPERRFNHGNGYLRKGKDGKYFQPAMAYAILKYSNFDDEWKHEILYDGLTQTDAENKEKQLIAKYKTNDSRYGYNISSGGNAMVGEDNPMYGKSLKDFISEEAYEQWKTNISVGVSKFYAEHPEECKKRSDRTKVLWENKDFREMFTSKMSGENNPNYGCHRFSRENHPMWGKHQSEESKKKNRDAHIGKQVGIDNPTSKPIYCPELNRIFWGAKQAHDEFGINVSHISDCCRGKRKHAGVDSSTNIQLSWFFCKDYEWKDGEFINGAVSLGYITQQDLDNYLNNLRQKEINDL